jgi:tetratricopeptide (TPR) repeat protein
MEEKEQWRREGWHPSFMKLTDEHLSSISKDQRQMIVREFVRDGASFFQRGYTHYGLQLWREAIRINPEIDLAYFGYTNEYVLAIFQIFKDEYNWVRGGKNAPIDPQPVQRAASDIIFEWTSNLPRDHLYMTHSKYAQNARCAYCGSPNILKAWPSNGDEVPFYYCKLEESRHLPGGYLVDVSCHKCNKVWCVVWDADPIGGSTYLRRTDTKDAEKYYDSGNTSYTSGRLDEAIANYSHALELDPKMVLAYYNRGHTYVDLGRYDEAMADYNRALEIDPSDPVVYLHIGNLLAIKGDLEGALSYFEQAAKLGDARGAAWAAQVKEMLKR